MSESVAITLPLPPCELSPNHAVGSRGGRLRKSAKTKKYRQTACLLAMVAQGNHRPLNWAAASVHAHFYFPNRRGRDGDNANASLKAAWDGLADAGVVSNDRKLTQLPPVMDHDKVNPRVVLTVTRTGEPTP